MAAARLEGSKVFCKDFLKRHHIPTAAYGVFTEINAARDYINRTALPMVVKADGLARWKGRHYRPFQGRRLKCRRRHAVRKRLWRGRKTDHCGGLPDWGRSQFPS